MIARQFSGGVGVTTVIAVLSVAAVGTLLSGLAVTTFTGLTNRLGFNASTLATGTSSLYKRLVTGALPPYAAGGSGGLSQAAASSLSLAVSDLASNALSLQSGSSDVATAKKSLSRAVCMTDDVQPESANLNFLFTRDTPNLSGGQLSQKAYLQGQIHGGLVQNLSYPMLVLSSADSCASGALTRASHLLHFPLAIAETARTLVDVPRVEFVDNVLDGQRRTVWLHTDGKPMENACCQIRPLA